MPNRISKHRVLAQLCSCRPLRDTGKSNGVEGQESLRKVGSVGYECSATAPISLLPAAIWVTIKRIILVCNNIKLQLSVVPARKLP